MQRNVTHHQSEEAALSLARISGSQCDPMQRNVTLHQTRAAALGLVQIPRRDTLEPLSQASLPGGVTQSIADLSVTKIRHPGCALPGPGTAFNRGMRLSTGGSAGKSVYGPA
jgi:hypothetical protein